MAPQSPTLIITLAPWLLHCFTTTRYFIQIVLESNATTELDGARAGVLSGLQIADGAEGRGTQAQIRHAVVGMVKEVRRRRANSQRETLLVLERSINRKRDFFCSRSYN